MKITEALLAEHLVFHHMFDHLETAAAGLKTLSEVKAVGALLEAMLKGHSDTEDELLLGPLEHCFEQIGQRDGFLREHEEMDESLRLIQNATQPGQARRMLLAAIAHSRKHFHKEERIVFPLAEQVLNAKTLTELSRCWREQRRMSNDGRAREASAPVPARRIQGQHSRR
jgi:hemerythrin-like domain-containing protein